VRESTIVAEDEKHYKIHEARQKRHADAPSETRSVQVA